MSAPSLSGETLCAPNVRVFSLHGQLNVSASGTVGKILYSIISPSLWGRSQFGWHCPMPEFLVGYVGIGATLEKWLLRWVDWPGLDHGVSWDGVHDAVKTGVEYW